MIERAIGLCPHLGVISPPSTATMAGRVGHEAWVGDTGWESKSRRRALVTPVANATFTAAGRSKHCRASCLSK